MVFCAPIPTTPAAFGVLGTSGDAPGPIRGVWLGTVSPMGVLEQEVQAAAELLRADGGDLRLVGVDDGVVTVELLLRDASCAECVMPAEFLERLLAGRLTQAGVPHDRVVVADPRRTDDFTVEFPSDDPDAVMDELERLGWGDGLPIALPTPERVERVLGHLPGDADEVLAVLPPRFGAVTRRVIAANAVMAGCRPEYAPVVLAAALALSRPEMNLRGVNATTHPVAPLLIVHGPVAEELGINGGRNAFGPGRRANATIGRAVRLVLIHVSGARAGVSDGVGDASTQGQPSKYSYCVAENAAASPWGPLHVARGCPSESAVTVHCGENPHNVHDMESTTPEPLLAKFASVMTTLGSNNGCISQGEFFIGLCPEHAATLAGAEWSRTDIATHLWNTARLPAGELRAAFANRAWSDWLEALPDDALAPMTDSADNIRIFVVGGPGKHSCVIPSWGVTRSVVEPIR